MGRKRCKGERAISYIWRAGAFPLALLACDMLPSYCPWGIWQAPGTVSDEPTLPDGSGVMPQSTGSGDLGLVLNHALSHPSQVMGKITKSSHTSVFLYSEILIRASSQRVMTRIELMHCPNSKCHTSLFFLLHIQVCPTFQKFALPHFTFPEDLH